ncbi:phage tail assembly protein [Campylobacter sp. faydin G-24]|uniref:Phage tail assembly protein n=1 Tax=Campylobacter anatolicus TaxID=2829105 RepID=A0ABS5HKC1_9BACT|nr:phage tail assembly protein [Campylobacter anatolicus]MBR8461439.1 phage tail assembly protein [Campylobacter anatolicus]MBR8464725.1 phage tail assembly protein [Campylobacter anatolicus]MBR8464749.1 phage tail assembly protein [Campylobacter anatolicus]
MKEITLKNGEILQMSEPTVRVLKNADKKEGEMEKAIYMIAALTNKTEQEIEALGLKDYMSLQKVLQDFLTKAGVTD